MITTIIIQRLTDCDMSNYNNIISEKTGKILWNVYGVDKSIRSIHRLDFLPLAECEYTRKNSSRISYDGGVVISEFGVFYSFYDFKIAVEGMQG